MNTSEKPVHINYKGVTLRCINQPLPWFEIYAGRSDKKIPADFGRKYVYVTFGEAKVYDSVKAAKVAISTYLRAGCTPYKGYLRRPNDGYAPKQKGRKK